MSELTLTDGTDASAPPSDGTPTGGLRALRERVLRGTLNVLALSVPAVADGDQALALLRESAEFALMCIDGVMPGTETATVLELASELAPGLRVLVCSGYVKEDLVRRGIALGKYGFLSKPFTGQQLLASVHSLLSSATDREAVSRRWRAEAGPARPTQ